MHGCPIIKQNQTYCKYGKKNWNYHESNVLINQKTSIRKRDLNRNQLGTFGKLLLGKAISTREKENNESTKNFKKCRSLERYVIYSRKGKQQEGRSSKNNKNSDYSRWRYYWTFERLLIQKEWCVWSIPPLS